jgi:hypothetical protein
MMSKIKEAQGDLFSPWASGFLITLTTSLLEIENHFHHCCEIII